MTHTKHVISQYHVRGPSSRGISRMGQFIESLFAAVTYDIVGNSCTECDFVWTPRVESQRTASSHHKTSQYNSRYFLQPSQMNHSLQCDRKSGQVKQSARQLALASRNHHRPVHSKHDTRWTKTGLHFTNYMNLSVYWLPNTVRKLKKFTEFYEIPRFITIYQEPASGTCPEPDESGSYPISLTYYSYTFPVVSFFQDFLPKLCTNNSSLTCVLHSQPTSSWSLW
jgi:hypothetical protein